MIFGAIVFTTSQLVVAKLDDQPLLKVTPNVCIVESAQTLCAFTISISFTVAPFKELCIEIKNHPQYRQCHEHAGVLKQQVNIQAQNPAWVRLVDPVTNRIIKEHPLSVAHYKAKDYRIKRRFGWSF